MNTQRGIVGTIVLIIAALILLGYFHIDIKTVAENPTVQDNLSYALSLVISGFVRLYHALLSAI